MAKGAVISLRVSEDEQSKLRHAADERGTSVSDLVRAVVLREVSDEPAIGAPAISSTASTPDAWRGPFWDVGEGATVQGSTVIVSP